MPTGTQSKGRGGKRSTSWKPGQTGNPGGRKPDAELRNARAEAARLVGPHVELAVQTLVDIMMNGKSEAARRASADSILDRRFGKAAESIDIGGQEDNPVEIAVVDAAITAAVNRLRKK